VGERFSAPVQTGPGAKTSSCPVNVVSYSWGLSDRGVGFLATSSNAVVKERVELLPLLLLL